MHEIIDPRCILFIMPRNTFFLPGNYAAILVVIITWFSTTTAQSQVALDSTQLPIIIIDTNGNVIKDEPKVIAHMGIIDNGSNQYNHVGDEFNDYDGMIGVEYRGSSSQFLFPKKNYGIELRTIDDQDTSVSILGLPAEEDWVLNGPYSDKSLMRNKLTFDLWSATGRYSSRTKFLELIVNGDYKGVYVLMEKIKRDSNRVDISKLSPDENSGDDVTGGYIVKLDKYDGSNSRGGWPSPHRPVNHSGDQEIFFQYEYPKGDIITSEQQQYIQNYIAGFENVLNNSGFGDPVSGYRAFIDDDSFVDFALINELTRNVDGYRLSTFLHKTKESKGGKLTLGPIWDFNLAVGNADYCNGGETVGWAWDFNYTCPGDYWLIPFWWDRLLTHYAFVEKLNNRWNELRSGTWSNASIMNYIDSTAVVLEQPQTRNFERWPILGDYIWPNNYVGATYQDEVNYIKSWMTQRLDWLDTHIADRFNVIAGVSDMEDHTNLYVFPNPFMSYLVLDTPDDIKSVRLYDASGTQLFYEEDIQQQKLRIDTHNLNKGIYYLSIYTQNGIINRKLLKI